MPHALPRRALCVWIAIVLAVAGVIAIRRDTPSAAAQAVSTGATGQSFDVVPSLAPGAEPTRTTTTSPTTSTAPSTTTLAVTSTTRPAVTTTTVRPAPTTTTTTAVPPGPQFSMSKSTVSAALEEPVDFRGAGCDPDGFASVLYDSGARKDMVVQGTAVEPDGSWVTTERFTFPGTYVLRAECWDSTQTHALFRYGNTQTITVLP
jgi:hypothetical protein